MWLRVAIGLLCAQCIHAAQPGATVEEIITMVRAAIGKHDADGALAKSLHKLKPAEKLSEVAVEELESEGAGRKAVVELERLRDISQSLPAPATAPVFSHDAAPDAGEQRGVVAAAREIALHYARSLPDFMCNEVVRRYDDLRGGWDLKDTLELKLSYFEQKENYQLLTVNGRATVRSFESVGGAVSEGEFGSMLFSIFAPESQTEFQWDHWTTLRSRVPHVFTFRIRAARSRYRIQFRSSPAFGSTSTVAGQHGFVYVDRETNQILRIAAEADSLPRDFPVQQSTTLLDYDFTTVADRRFLLPLRAEVRMAASRVHTRNLVEFHGYRKFSGDSTITFQ